MKERFAEAHVECPCYTESDGSSGSSDAFCIRQDNSGFCFSCWKDFQENSLEDYHNKRNGINLDIADKISEQEHSPEDERTEEKSYMSLRGISRKTMEKYGVEAKSVGGMPIELGFPYGEDAYKVRKLERVNNKLVVRCLGDFSEAGLFGQPVFDPGSKESITIFEGELDALSGYDMLRGRSACVSLKTGAGSAFSDLSRQWEYVNSFEKIYLCFDSDAKGQEALKSVQGLFDFKKVYLVKYHKHKDANEYLQAGEGVEFYRTWESAKRYTPDNIISSFKDIEQALEDSNEDQIGSYPFPELEEKLYGIHAGEVVIVKAPEGVGKTELFRALEHFNLKETQHNIGIIHLEEDNATTIKAIAGYELEVPAVLPDCGLSKQDILRAYRSAVRDDEGRVHIHSSFDVEDEHAFFGNMRFLVSAAGCRLIFWDHISWMGTGLDTDDERKKLDRISQKAKMLAKELRFGLVIISHVNDDGKTRGSRNISKVANTVISIERDLLSGSNVMNFLVEKARLGGRTGPAGKAIFDRGKGKLIPIDDMELPDA